MAVERESVIDILKEGKERGEREREREKGRERERKKGRERVKGIENSKESGGCIWWQWSMMWPGDEASYSYLKKICHLLLKRCCLNLLLSSAVLFVNVTAVCQL